MSLKLYVVRHGQSEANLAKVFYNDSETKLTTLGETQAMNVGQKIKNLNIDFDDIYCSTYSRARFTCLLALESAGIRNRKINYDKRLIERQLNGLFDKPFDKESWIEMQNFNSDLAEKNGIETFDELESRARSFIEEVKVKHPNGNVLVFTHGLLELAIYTTIYDRPASGTTYDLRLLENAEMRIYEI